MKRLPCRSLAAVVARAVLVLLLGVQVATRLLSREIPRQAPSSQAAGEKPTKTQRVANPLNDLLDEAQRSIDANQFEAALPPLQKFLEEKPEVAFAHFQLAYAYTALHRSDEARAQYERAMSLDPKMPEAYLNLGILLLDKQDYAAAVAPLSKAVELLPAQSRP